MTYNISHPDSANSFVKDRMNVIENDILLISSKLKWASTDWSDCNVGLETIIRTSFNKTKYQQIRVKYWNCSSGPVRHSIQDQNSSTREEE